MRRRRLALVGALLFNPAIGSLYAWSLFLAPLEQAIGVPRAELSAVFSLAVVCFTLSAAGAPASYRLLGRSWLVALPAALCAGGLALAASGGGMTSLLLGYGALFGTGSGLGYSAVLQALNLAWPRRKGLVNGFGIGLFALGSVVFAPLYGWSNESWGPMATFAAMAVLFVAVGLLAGGCFALSGISVAGSGALRAPPGEAGPKGVFPLIWFAFMLGAGAGLMAISQAAGMVVAYGGAPAAAVAGTTLVAVGNGAGRLAGGWLCDHLPIHRVAVLAHLVAAAGLGLLLLLPVAEVAVLGVACVGLSYGLNSGVYPASVGIYFGAASFGRMFGRLITAWGVAGLTAPWLAGLVFDWRGGYSLAVAIALACSLAAVMIAVRLPAPPEAGTGA